MDDEQHYAALADELNDADIRITCARCDKVQLVKVQCEACGNDMDPMADFDPHYVIAGERYARANNLSWPPQIGDFDRYCERRWEAERRNRKR